MNEKIKELLQKAVQDDQLAAKLEACKTSEEAYAVAVSVVEGVSKEEFVSAMKQLKAAIDASTTLTEEDIGKMAGGIDSSEVSVIVGATLSATSGAAAIAGAI